MLYLLATNTCFGLACPVLDPESYHQIYHIKHRSPEKAIAVMVADFDWLAKNTTLTWEQISFLKSYEYPFTVLTESPVLQQAFNQIQLFNADRYEKVALRIAHTPEQKALIDQIWPIFLTSANRSDEGEIYEIKKLRATFEKEIKSWILQELWPLKDLEHTPPSQLFAFESESLKQIFFRS